jgi:hypothetical protein
MINRSWKKNTTIFLVKYCTDPIHLSKPLEYSKQAPFDEPEDVRLRIDDDKHLQDMREMDGVIH